MPKSLIRTLICAILLSGCATYDSSPMPQYNGTYHGTAVRPIADAAWKALGVEDYSEAMRIAEECIGTYGTKAVASNEPCGRKDVIPDSADCGILNEVSECWAIKVLTYQETNEWEKLKGACAEIQKNYSNSFVWEPHGCWPWKAPELCDSILEENPGK